ncbi:MAG: response regulator [Bacteroidetes bacterium]|nr:response regulator [Bacteroidota bacterium]
MGVKFIFKNSKLIKPEYKSCLLGNPAFPFVEFQITPNASFQLILIDSQPFNFIKSLIKLQMNVLIIDEDSNAAERLTVLLKEIDKKIEVIGQLESVGSSLRWLNEFPMPDLIFMGIQLSDGSGFEIFEQIDVQTPVVFMAATSEFALQAIKVNALDYLLKPLKKAEVEVAVDKFHNLKPSVGSTSTYKQVERPNPRFLIRFGQNFRLVELRVAAFIYTEDKMTFIVTKEGRRYPVQYSLEKLEEMADSNTFFRINRQFIVNIESIREMYAHTKSRVKLVLEPSPSKETVVSSVRSPQFKRWLLGAEAV